MSSGFVRETVDIAAPPERVWDRVVDWPRQSEWIPATRVRSVTEGTGIGTQIEARTGVGRLSLLDTMTVTAWDPPRRCEVLHTGRVLRGEAGFVVTPLVDHGARLEWWERFDLPAGPAGRLAWPAARQVVQLGLRRALRSLRQSAES
ncbi:MAG TPA: SRPBCC family protein [Nocardioidaceae bacterium]|nr:SRPBCC family protein [Nocardioidaceae bacterium]